MIQVHITTDKKDLAIEISDLLVSKRLIVDALILDSEKRLRVKKNEIISKKQYLILGKTKSILFESIDNVLKNKYGNNLPTLYSVPIVQMDWDQSSELREKTANG